MSNGPVISIGTEKAIKLAESNWWIGKDPKEVAMFQLFIAELCMDFSAFHEAIEKALGRPVFTHEFGLNYDRLCKEILGEKAAPSFEEIMNLIPEEKRLLIQVG